MGLLDGYLDDKKEVPDKTKTIIDIAVKKNPDQFAAAKRSASILGVDTGFVERNPKDTERMVKQRQIDLDALRVESPKTHSWLSGYENAAIAHDDVENLGALEKTITAVGDVGANIHAAPYSLASGFYGAGEVGARFLSEHLTQPIGEAAKQIFGYNDVVDPAGVVADYFQGLATDTKGTADTLTVGNKKYGLVGKSVLSGIQSGFQSLGIVGAGIATGQPALALNAFMAQSLGSSAHDALSKGVPVDNALIHGLAQGVIEKYTEKMSIGPLIDMMKGKTGFGKQLVDFTAREMGGEQVATVLQDLNDWATLPENKDKSFKDYLEARPEAALSTAIATAVGGSVQVSVIKGVQAIANRASDEAQKVKQSEQGAQMVEKINKLATSSKLLGRSPESFQEFIKQASEDAPVQAVFIDANTLMQSGIADSVAELSPSVAEQLDNAVATGGQISIPVDEYATKIAPTEYASVLLDDIKTDSEGFSRNEANQFMESQAEDLQREVERTLLESELDKSFKESSESVHNEIKSQLDTAKRFTPEVNDSYASMVSSFYSVTAAKLNTTPSELYQRYPLKIGAEPINGPSLSQKQPTLDAVIEKWDESGIKSFVSEKDDTIHLSKIIVPQNTRGVGLGTQSMKQLVEYADNTGKRIVLSPSSDFGGSKSRLTKFYKRFGFVENKGSNKDYTTSETMLRDPTGGYFQLDKKSDELAKNTISEYKVDGVEKGGVYEVNEQLDLPLSDGGMGRVSRNTGSVARDRVRLQKTGEMATGITKVTSSADAAHIIASLRKEAQENLVALVLDKDNNAISVIEHTTGGADRAAVFPGMLAGAIASTPGAHSYYIAHNHPSDTAQLSDADVGVLNRLNNLTTAAGINGLDILAVTPDGKYAGNFGSNLDIPTAARTSKVSIKTRRIFGKIKSEPIDRPDKLGAAVEVIAKGKTGVILTDIKMRPVRFVEISIDDMRHIKGTPAAGEYLKAVHRSNALKQFIVGDGEFALTAGQNMQALGNMAGLKTQDVYHISTAKSFVSVDMFDPYSSKDVFFQAEQSHTPRVPEIDLDGKPVAEQLDMLEAAYPDEAASLADRRGVVKMVKLKRLNKTGSMEAQEVKHDLVDKIEVAQKKKDRAFTRWFGNSVVTDSDGKPKVVYHGTGAKVTDSFIFDYSRIGEQGRAEGAGFYFTENKDIADSYGGKGSTLDVYLSIENPISYDQEGFDNETVRDILSKMAQAEVDKFGIGIGDGFLSNFGDVNYEGLNAVLDSAAESFDGMSALDQLSSMVGAGGDIELVNRAAHDVTGHDGVVTDGFSDQGGDKIYVAFFPEQIKSTKAIEYDKSNPDIFFQGENARGAFNPETLSISLLKNADLSTFLHESGHFFLEAQFDIATKIQDEADVMGEFMLKDSERELLNDMDSILKWFGVSSLAEWDNLDFESKRQYHEQYARGFEAYLFEGKSPNIEMQGLFQRFRAWMLNVYKNLKNLNVELSDDVRGVFDRMLATDEQIKLAEQGRSLMPLFESPDQAGMTTEEFATYQALGTDATNEAIEDLQGRALRDMKWLHNARSRKLKELQKEAKTLRADIRKVVHFEVLNQPIYRAWQFLTNKVTEHDKLPTPDRDIKSDVVDETQDSLFTAIAKLGGLNREQAQSEWGIDPKEKSPMPMFGKYVLRNGNNGLMIDDMAERLVELGYLKERDFHEFESLFMDSLGGGDSYSIHYDHSVHTPGENATDDIGSGRFDLSSLMEMGLPSEVTDKLGSLDMVVDDGGWHPDLVADRFNLTSGDELVRKIVELNPPKDEIESITDVRMLEQYGDLSTPEAISTAADAAIHNDVRARMVATEANALAKATGQRKVLASAAKEFAKAMIARLRVRDIRPGQHSNAEARAARAADKASRSGDLPTAAAEKRNQLVQGYAAKAAHDAKAEIEKGVKFLKKFDSDGVRKNLDVDYMDQIDAMLERFDLRKSVSNKALNKRASLAEWIETQREVGFDPDIPQELENELNRKSYKDMTVEEFRGVIDSVKQIEHLARLKHNLLTAKDKREFDAIVSEASSVIRDNGGDERPVQLEPSGRFKSWQEGVRAGHRKLNSLFRQFDGGKDGGLLWELLGRTMNTAADNETAMIEKATERLTDIYKPILALKGGLNGDKRFIPAIGGSLTRAGRLSIALNWGNEINRKRIMDGDKWSEQQVNGILATLTETEAQFVNDVWEYIDSFWSDVAAKEKRVTGREPEKVEAESFPMVIDGGKVIDMRGGYYPIKYDAERDSKAESQQAAEVAKDMLRGAVTRSTTRRGHTKQRVEYVGRPVKKSLDVITQHVSEVVHDLSWHEWLIDSNRLMSAKPIDQAIRTHYGPEIVRAIKGNLESIATADIVPQTAIDTALLYLRSNVSRSTMGFSVTTSLLQPFGLAQSMVRIGPKYVLRGMARWGGDVIRLQNTMTWIGEKSQFMSNRNKTFNRELREINGRVNKGHSTARQIYDASLFMMMQKMQLVADVPTWVGAYEKALDEGNVEDRAVALADQAVLDSQGGGQVKDLSQVQIKHPMFTMFYSYFNTTYNLISESTAKTNFKQPLAVAGWLSDMMLLTVIPALAPAIILELLRGGGDDDDSEEWGKKLIQWEAGYLMGLMIGVRELSGSVSGFSYSGPPAGRVISDIGRLGKQAEQGELDRGLVESSVKLLGSALGIPTTQMVRSYKGWEAWVDGDAPVTSVLVGPPPKN